MPPNIQQLKVWAILLTTGICLSSLASCKLPFVPESETATRTPVRIQPTHQDIAEPVQTITKTPAIETQTLIITNTVNATLTPEVTTTYTLTPSATSSPSPVTITIEDTLEGNYLVVKRATDNLEYKLGPIADGVYAIGPNSNFFVYCTDDGKVYAAKIGAKYLSPIGDVRYFTAIRRGTKPSFAVDIFFNTNFYRANVQEKLFNQNEIILIPRNITEE
jgi:hypothetical protein